MRKFYFLCLLSLILVGWGCRPHPRRWQGQWQLERVQNKHLQHVNDALLVLRLLGVEEAALGSIARQAARQLTIELREDGYFEGRVLGAARLLRGQWRRRVLPRRLELVFSLPVTKKEKRIQLPVSLSPEQMRWHNFDRSGSVIILKRK